MWYFCKYKNSLGKPKEGFHSIRFLNIAVLDVLATIVLAKFFQYYFFIDVDLSIILFFTFILGVIMHRIFCVETTIDKLLFK
tara:strand:- start:162 stop:407 length:246 start_codon:yes stop_codon:yes gene_type:complete